LPYLRFERPSAVADDDGATWCDSMEDAAAQAMVAGQRIFLATGSKDLARFLQAPGAQDKQWFVRVTAEPEFLQRALDLGVPRNRICAMQGPFSAAFNQALWQDWKIDCVVTKDSGAAGGYRAKADAARALGIPLLTVRRTVLDYPQQAGTIAQACELVAQRFSGAIAP